MKLVATLHHRHSDARKRSADHIVNILPGSTATRHFCDAKPFAVSKAGSVFHNIGRGTTVVQDAFLAALHSGRIGADGLDVTKPNLCRTHHSLGAELNCFITPRVSGGHVGETKTLVRHFLKKHRAVRSQRTPSGSRDVASQPRL